MHAFVVTQNLAEQKENSEELHDADAENNKAIFFTPMVSPPVIVSTTAKNCYKR